ncbi:MAG TPA: N(4)-(beta-N-acetylglucosaminyl)-L-asparaginase [Fimbriimonadaceae bacterium]|nr:N(4)-(beta-N-acetylglucosaminyl)-L-asparaginase [Fimbriimonadaceae bacterium]
MGKRISRRTLVIGGAGAAAGIAANKLAKAVEVPHVWLQTGVQPRVISSANGNIYKNGGAETCVQRAFRLITDGRDPLESVIAGVNICELDPLDMSVGYGGLPNADGVVQLDSCCMHGPRRWAGGVAALEGVRTPSNLAYWVASQTDHHLIVGQGAQNLARQVGLKVEDDLNTEASRRAWLEWKRRTDPEHYLDPAKRDGLLLQMAAEGLIDPEHLYGTINCNAITAKGEIAGVTTTSGLAFKIPGRVGDSPILGAGLYVDGQVGAAGSTGRGEANLYNLCSFLIVDEIRRGSHPKDAGMEALRRVVANTKEKRLLNERGEPNLSLNFYILDAKGRYAGVALRPGRFAICDDKGPRIENSEGLLRPAR